MYCVLVRTDGRWYEIPLGAIGLEDVLHELQGLLGCELPMRMTSGCESRILWPVELKDAALFDYYEVKRPLWERILKWWYPREFGKRLRPEVDHWLLKHAR